MSAKLRTTNRVSSGWTPQGRDWIRVQSGGLMAEGIIISVILRLFGKTLRQNAEDENLQEKRECPCN